MSVVTYVFSTPKAIRVGNTPFGIVTGTATMVSYASGTGVLDEALLGMFKRGSALLPIIAANGGTSNGYIAVWEISGAVGGVITQAEWVLLGSGAAAGDPLEQPDPAAAGVAGAQWDFIAVGQMG